VIKICFLGTNGWFDTSTGNTPCVLIKSKEYNIIFDAGNGIYKLDKYIKDEKPIYLFLSHLHLDHISGLHIFSKFRFTQGIKIGVSKKRLKAIKNFTKRPFTRPYSELDLKIEFFEFDSKKSNLPFEFKYFKMFHDDLAFGFRLTLDGKTIAYSGDTGICKNSLALAKSADLLIHECTFESGHPKDPWGHVTPETVAKLAKEAKVKKLYLIHFDANIYTSLAMRYNAEKIAQKIFPNTFAATDGLVINLL